jgi:hypothetical protein
MSMTRTAWWSVAVLAGLLAAGIVPLMVWQSLLKGVKFEPERPFDLKLAQKVVAEVAHGKMKPDGKGAVVLPARYASLSAATSRRIWVTHRGSGLTLILFPTWQGKGSNLAGYLFCSRPLIRADTHPDYYEQKHDAIDLTYYPYPLLKPVPGGERSVEVTLDRKVSPAWYEVSHSLD